METMSIRDTQAICYGGRLNAESVGPKTLLQELCCVGFDEFPLNSSRNFGGGPLLSTWLLSQIQPLGLAAALFGLGLCLRVAMALR